MLRSATPPSFPIAFASSAAGGFIRAIPTASQIGIQNGAASLTDGFPPLNFSPVAAGGVPPFGEDFNGLLNQITLWNQWQEAGGPVIYNSAFSTSIGGYPQGATLASSILIGREWVSLVDNNTTNPDTSSSANWAAVGVPVGAPIASLSTTVPNGYVLMNGLTIGNAASNATERANADTFFLFVFNWQNFSNTQCPLLNSSGTPVARGANAFADFAANNALTMPSLKGTALIGADTMAGAASTLLSGVPVQSGSITVPGSVVGENLHTLTATETPTNITSVGSGLAVAVVTTVGNVVQGSVVSSTTGGGSFAIEILSGGGASAVNSNGTTAAQSVVTNNTGGGAHDNVDRSMIVFWGQKL